MPDQDPSPTDLILRVALDTPLRRLFDYRAPASLAGTVLPGMRADVPFGKRRVIGTIIEVTDHSEVPSEKLRAAHAILDTEPALDAAILGLLRFAADYYHHPLGEVVASALPTGLREGRPLKALEPRWRLSGAGLAALAGKPRLGPRQRELTQWLTQRGEISLTDLETLGESARAA